jgi:hypothetical protein
LIVVNVGAGVGLGVGSRVAVANSVGVVWLFDPDGSADAHPAAARSATMASMYPIW